LGELCLRKAHYAAERITASKRFSLPFVKQATFKEFVVRDHRGDVARLLSQAEGAGVLAGVPLATWYPEWSDCFLVAVTEKRTRAEIDLLAATLARPSINSSSQPTTPAYA
jgi:glycine dehydrogenase subunit 1